MAIEGPPTRHSCALAGADLGLAAGLTTEFPARPTGPKGAVAPVGI